MNNYKDLILWQKAMQLVKLIYKLTANLPDSEKFGLQSQIKRCAVSIPSNIAEGAGRNSKKAFANFLSIANGSTSELETQLLLLIDLNFIEKDSLDDVFVLLLEVQKMNNALQAYLNREIKTQD